jgi:hypothetical protein
MSELIKVEIKMADGSEWFWLGKMSKKKLDLLTQIADLMSDQEDEEK